MKNKVLKHYKEGISRFIEEYKELFLNTLYFLFVFVFALGLATQALARKVNTLQTITTPVFFYVDKQEIAVSSEVAGNVLEVTAFPGQHVNKGDLIVRIDTSDFDRRVSVLEGVANQNFSARTELDVLKTKRDAYEIYAPQSGVIYNMSVSSGSFLSIGSIAFTLFSDDNAKLISYVTPAQYAEIQSNANAIEVYSKRLEQIFAVKLEGIGRMTADPMIMQNTNSSGDLKYELIFQFKNSEDGAVFIEQESLQLVNSIQNDAIKRPMDRVAQLWNALIMGK